MKKCNRCGNEKNDEEFVSIHGKILKRYSYYQNYDKIQKQNNKYIHNHQQARCKECGGASICSHNRERRRCKDCGTDRLNDFESRQKSSLSSPNKLYFSPAGAISSCVMRVVDPTLRVTNPLL